MPTWRFQWWKVVQVQCTQAMITAVVKRARAREFLLLTSYIFIGDLSANSADYKLTVRRLPFCSGLVISPNVDLFSLRPSSRFYVNELDWIKPSDLSRRTEIPAKQSMKQFWSCSNMVIEDIESSCRFVWLSMPQGNCLIKGWEKGIFFGVL